MRIVTRDRRLALAGRLDADAREGVCEPAREVGRRFDAAVTPIDTRALLESAVACTPIRLEIASRGFEVLRLEIASRGFDVLRDACAPLEGDGARAAMPADLARRGFRAAVTSRDARVGLERGGRS